LLLEIINLSDIGSSKDPGVYVIFAIVGLYTSIASVWPIENRSPNKRDFIKFTAYGPFVIAYSLLLASSPLYAFLIGIIPGPLIQGLIKIAKKLLTETINESEDKK
jgi:hypothetical protein